ncbi:hypothetical protein MBANPS3_003636 [Mucor bainieri]
MLSIVKTIFYCFYPLETDDAKKRQKIDELQRVPFNQSTTRATQTDTPQSSNKNPSVSKPFVLKPASNESRGQKEHPCSGCGLSLRHDKRSRRSRHKKNSGLCFACTAMFRLAKGDDLIQRFKQNSRKRHHEVRFAKHLHKMQGTNDSIFSKTDLYHLPLSINYYSKLNQKYFVHHSSYPEHNTVSHFKTCTGCRLFVLRRRRTLVNATKRKRGGANKSIEIASFQDLFELMVSSNSSCAFSGKKGVWHSFGESEADPLYSLSLDHKVPLSKRGPSTIDNLQVSLVCLNEIKGTLSNKKFVTWWTAFRRKQGCF